MRYQVNWVTKVLIARAHQQARNGLRVSFCPKSASIRTNIIDALLSGGEGGDSGSNG
jgi:hypothetical protein